MELCELQAYVESLRDDQAREEYQVARVCLFFLFIIRFILTMGGSALLQFCAVCEGY